MSAKRSELSTIEHAAQRLEQLRLAGVAVPWDAAGLSAEALRQGVDAAATPKRRAGVGDRIAGPIVPLPTRERVSLDVDRLHASGLLVPSEARSALGEQLRQVKRPLLRNARAATSEDRKSLIMVTSALPREGKTFCAINLAMSMALEIDVSVLLVDADVLRPSVLTRLGLSPHKGLLDVLSANGEVDLADVMLATNVPNLTLLPSGSYNSRSTELLASAAMDKFLAELVAKYPDHVVLFDTPPLLVTNEAKVLASRLGQVLMVVDASRTPRTAVQQALVHLEQSSCVSVVLNRGRSRIRDYGYEDYYG